MKPYSQRDPQWAGTQLGFSNTTIGGFGCTITCLAMITEIPPNEVNDRIKNVNGYANGNLVRWEKLQEALPGITFRIRRYGDNNAEINGVLNDYGFCMVEVDFDGSPRTGDRHWVLYLPGGLLADPWTGTIDRVSKYPMVTGYSIISYQESGMTEEQANRLIAVNEKILKAIQVSNLMYMVQNNVKFIKPTADATCYFEKTRRRAVVPTGEHVEAGLVNWDMLNK